MRKEKLVLEFDSVSMRNRAITDFQDCIEFAAASECIAYSGLCADTDTLTFGSGVVRQASGSTNAIVQRHTQVPIGTSPLGPQRPTSVALCAGSGQSIHERQLESAVQTIFIAKWRPARDRVQRARTAELRHAFA